ncbi:DTYMK [Cervus elaphus hippelaphus]|uniref:dTMP kinase n=1 Tax=Cervus elaphus hippelaphus TaxID=46360 RepID=A0A212CEW1_CEREH|nr:DTYMK [Cervus elaphus hippelaphus]
MLRAWPLCLTAELPLRLCQQQLCARPWPLMKEKLSQGVTLVVDRYAFSGVAFTSAKENFSLDWCKQPDVGLPKPDLVVFLQLQLAEAAVRGEFGRERYESGPFQQRALQRFQQLLADPSLPWKVSATWALGLVQEGPLPGQGSRGCSAAGLGPTRGLPCPEHGSSPGPRGPGAIPVAPAATSCMVPTASGHFQSWPVSSLPAGGIHGRDGPHACQLGSCISLRLVLASQLP